MSAPSRLQRIGAVPVLEWKELAIACAMQLLIRGSLRALPFKSVLRLGACRLPRARHPLTKPDLERVVRWSTRLCGGTCLSESLLTTVLARRHGLEVPVIIGVARVGGVFRAHAWTGEPEAGQSFVALWPVDRQRR